MSGLSTKMGIDEDEYIKSFEFISRLEHVCIKGIHVFAASGILDYRSLIDVAKYIFEFVSKTSNKTGNLEVSG